MIWGLTRQQKYETDHSWFAWRPVRLVDGRWVWLQRVYWMVEKGNKHNHIPDRMTYFLQRRSG